MTNTLTMTAVEDLDRFWNDDSGDAHASPDCVEAGPGGWVEKGAAGWLCGRCIDVDVRRVLPHNAPSVDAPERGDGSGSSSAPRTDLPSEKQLAFLLRLVGEKLETEDPEAWVEQLVSSGLTKRGASKAIDELISLPAIVRSVPAADSVPAAEATYRWTKRSGVWLVRGPAKNDPTGQTITVTKASGETAQAIIVEEIESGLYRVKSAEESEVRTGGIGSTMFALRDRIVELTGAQTKDRSLRVCVPAEVLGVKDQDDAAYLLSWSYDWKGAERHTGGVGEIRALDLGDESVTKLVGFLLAATPEEFRSYQVAYGQHFETCGRCGSPLSDKTSKLRGLGPDCAKIA